VYTKHLHSCLLPMIKRSSTCAYAAC